ncbi:hypothetical protein C8Q80DRAFT_1201544 [Daedaleopsis nitida]|nr:hypothetical protein C8Q80DRAFT_1201544 [Daedaleopsis nitida]
MDITRVSPLLLLPLPHLIRLFALRCLLFRRVRHCDLSPCDELYCISSHSVLAQLKSFVIDQQLLALFTLSNWLDLLERIPRPAAQSLSSISSATTASASCDSSLTARCDSVFDSWQPAPRTNHTPTLSLSNCLDSTAL